MKININTSKLIHGILDWVFPFLCVSCSAILERNKYEAPLCADCLNSIRINNSGFCGTCKARVPLTKKKRCHKGSQNTIFAATHYSNAVIRKSLAAFKYDGVKTLKQPYQNLISAYIKQSRLKEVIKSNNICIIPVPLFRTKINKRGYNQSEILAQALKESLAQTGSFNIEINNNCITRTRNTQTQSGQKSHEARRNNISDCFTLQSKALSKETQYIILDDIYTSGATMNEMIKTLRTSGVKKIICLVLALA